MAEIARMMMMKHGSKGEAGVVVEVPTVSGTHGMLVAPTHQSVPTSHAFVLRDAHILTIATTAPQ